jgi:hypothetical protein
LSIIWLIHTALRISIFVWKGKCVRKSLKLSQIAVARNSNKPIDDTCNEAERRDHDRYLTIFRAVKLTSGTSESLCVARNLSPGGIMIDVSAHYAIGQNICVSFAEDQQFEGQVVWQRAVTIGVKFNSEIDIKQVLEKSRHPEGGYKWRMPRIQVCQQVELWVGSKILLIELCNISQCGAQIKTDHDLGNGELLKMIVKGLDPISGTVRWQHNGYSGIEFTKSIPISALMQWQGGADSI